MSEAVLNFLNQSAKLQVTGFPWMTSDSLTIPPNALASKVLCERHNSALSDLDSTALRFFKACDESRVGTKGLRKLHLFSGHDIERWFLKILCGAAYSGNLKTDDGTKPNILPHWTEVLFGAGRFASDQGLYMCKDIGHAIDGEQGVGIRPITKLHQLSGLGVLVCGYEFIISLSGFPNRRFDDRNFAYRPMEIHMKNERFESSILFCWEGAADLGTIECS